MTTKYENKLDAMHLEQFETLTDEELSAVQGGYSVGYHIGHGLGEIVGAISRGVSLWF